MSLGLASVRLLEWRRAEVAGELARAERQRARAIAHRDALVYGAVVERWDTRIHALGVHVAALRERIAKVDAELRSSWAPRRRRAPRSRARA